jgi:multiple sugar transport system substrate-binding protein
VLNSKLTSNTLFRMLMSLMLLSLMLAACTPAAATTEAPSDETDEPEVVETDAPVDETDAPVDETDAPATETEAVAGGASGDLAVMGFSYETGDDIAQNRVNLFTEQNPDVNMTFTEGGLDEQQFLTAVASGEAPDLVYMGRDVIGTYAARGAIMSLDQCIADQGIDMGQYYDSAVAQVTLDGQVYGVPEFYNSIIVMANTAALEDAGLTMDDLDTSDWDAIAAANEAMTSNDGELTRIGFDPKLPEFLPLWAKANGVELISADGRTAQLNSPEVVEALEFAASLHEAAGGRQNFMAFRDTWDFFGGGNQFAADQLGAMPMEQWYLNVIAGNSPDAPMAFAPFLDREGNPISYATGNTWAIPTGAANPDAACAFMKTVTSVDAWTTASQARADARAAEGQPYTGTYTANEEADQIIFNEIMQPTGTVFDEGIQTVLDIMPIAISIPGNPAANEFKQAWMDAVNRVLNGEQTAQEALDQAQEEAQAALDDAWAEVDE